MAPQPVGKQHVWCQQILEWKALVVTVLGTQNDQARPRLRCSLGLDDRFVEVTEPEPTPLKVTLRPGCYAVKVRGLLDAWQFGEFGPDHEMRAHIAPDRNLQSGHLRGEPKPELPKPE